MRGILKRLRHMFVSDDFKVDGHSWYYRVSEGEYDWAIALSASPQDNLLYLPHYPFTIYAYRVRVRHTGDELYILAMYPRGCIESGCAIYLIATPPPTDDELVDKMEEVAKLVPLYYEDPQSFFDKLAEKEIYPLSHTELVDFEFIRPHKGLARKFVEIIGKKKYVEIRRI